MAGWPWPLTSWMALTTAPGPDHTARTAVHRGICREMGEAGGGLRLGPGWRHRVQPSRQEKSTANRPKSVNSSVAMAHSHAAEAERSGQAWRMTTAPRGQGPHQAGRIREPSWVTGARWPLAPHSARPGRNGLRGSQTLAGMPSSPSKAVSQMFPLHVPPAHTAFPTSQNKVLTLPSASPTPSRPHHHHLPLARQLLLPSNMQGFLKTPPSRAPASGCVGNFHPPPMAHRPLPLTP